MKAPRPILPALALSLAAIALVAGLGGCYISAQAGAYLALRSKAKPVAKVLADPATRPEVRAMIERVARIRAFAIGELGLKDTKNYTSIVELDSDRLATVVQACAELSFTRYLWNYPVVGRLPYQGYFDPKGAEAEAARLRKEGWDVLVRPVDAFSTLGWFDDPLYSFMDSYSEADLADLVIHEMTHATAFSKAAGDFNEELATYVGREGARLYLESREGPDSPSAREAAVSRHDAEALSAFLRGTAAELEEVYASGLADADKRARKAAIIAARAAAFRESYATLFESGDYRSWPMDRVNNAWLDLYRLYEGEPELYADYERKVCGGDLPRFLREARRLASSKEDPKELMRRELAAASGAGGAP